MSHPWGRVVNRGPLAGLTAGSAAVLVFGIGLLWMVWHRVSGLVADAVLVMVGTAVVVVVFAGGYVVVVLILRARLHVERPETLLRQRRVVVPPPMVAGHRGLPRPEVPAIDAPVERLGWPVQDARWDEVR